MTRTKSPSTNGPVPASSRTTPRQTRPVAPLVPASSALTILRTPLTTGVKLEEKVDDDTTTIDALQDGSATKGTTTGMDIVNADAFKTDLRGARGAEFDPNGKEFESISGGSTGTEIAGGGLSIFTAVTGFLGAVQELYRAQQEGRHEDMVSSAFEMVLKAGEGVKGAITIAEKGAGAVIAKTVVPGLDLAFACVSLLGNIVTLFRLHVAAYRESEAIDAAIGKQDKDLELALGTVHARTLRKLALTWVQTAGDITMIIGGACQFAVGPWGTVVKLVGGLIKVVGAASGVVAEHFEAKATKAARDEFKQAELDDDPNRLKEAHKARLSADALYAVHEMLDKGLVIKDGTAASGTTAATPDAIDPQMKTLFASYGLGPTFLGKWLAAKGNESAKKTLMIEAENTILRFVGASRDPKTISQAILGGLKAVWDWFKSVTGAGSVAAEGTTSPAQVTVATKAKVEPIINQYAVKKQTSGDNGVKPIVMTNTIEDAYNKLVARYTVGCADEQAAAANAGAIDEGIRQSITAVQTLGLFGRTFPIDKVKVRGGVVYFPYPYPSVATADPTVVLPQATKAATPIVKTFAGRGRNAVTPQQMQTALAPAYAELLKDYGTDSTTAVTNKAAIDDGIKAAIVAEGPAIFPEFNTASVTVSGGLVAYGFVNVPETEVKAQAKQATAPIIRAYADKKAKRGSNGVKPEQMTKDIASAYASLVAQHKNWNKTTDATVLDAIDAGIKEAVLASGSIIQSTVDLRTIVVRRGVVTFREAGSSVLNMPQTGGQSGLGGQGAQQQSGATQLVGSGI